MFWQKIEMFAYLQIMQQSLNEPLDTALQLLMQWLRDSFSNLSQVIILPSIWFEALNSPMPRESNKSATKRRFLVLKGRLKIDLVTF